MCDGCGFVVQTDGRTPLYAASENGRVEAVPALVGAGAAVNQADVSEEGEAGCVSLCVCVGGVGEGREGCVSVTFKNGHVEAEWVRESCWYWRGIEPCCCE